MRVYHDLQKLNADTSPLLSSTCGHLKVQTFISDTKLRTHGLMFYMQAHEHKLQKLIETILKK